MRKKKSIKNVIIVLTLCGLYYFLKDGEVEINTPSSRQIEVVDASYEQLKDCVLVADRRNDGDSFSVKHQGGETEFRLYYVDAPESAYKEYRNGENNGDRLDQQAAYFGINRETAIAVGEEAKEYVKKVLKSRPFTVLTKWENVYGPERKYAFVIIEEEGEASYLHEILVKKGLARIHTKPTSLPSGATSREQLNHLRGLERRAKQQKLGAWTQ